MLKKNKDIMGRIYIITNKINNKVYIGQTITTLNERWSQHKCDSKRKHTAIANAILKYGVDNFKMDLIEDNIPYDELDKKEIYYIKQYNCICPNGYNITDGGQTYKTDEYREFMSERVMGENNPMYGMCGELNPFYGREHTQETKDTIGRKTKEWWNNISEEEYQKKLNHLNEMRKKMIEENGGGFKGKHHTQESKELIRSKLIGIEFSEEHKEKIKINHARKQKVVMFNKNDFKYIETFETMAIASDWLKKNTTYSKAKSSEISQVCSHKKRSVYGYTWMYYEEYINNNYEYLSYERSNSRKVICLNNTIIFDSVTLASEYANVRFSGITACCSGKQKTSGKHPETGEPLRWMYYDNYLKLNKQEDLEKVAN